MGERQGEKRSERGNPRKGNHLRIRRVLAAAIATTALAGLSLTGAVTATATSYPAGQGAAPTVGECEQGGGTVHWATWTCVGGKYAGQKID
ncbi:hypothetical protein [Streptomyces sp. NPDC003393]